MQQQEPHELMPVSPSETAQDGQEVLMGPQGDPAFRQDPKNHVGKVYFHKNRPPLQGAKLDSQLVKGNQGIC